MVLGELINFDISVCLICWS